MGLKERLRNVHQSEGAKINPLLPRNNEEELKVGYKCKTLGVETANYSPEGYVQWILVKKDGGNQIWATHTTWGPIYVGYVEDGLYNFDMANEVCNKYENIVLDEKPYQIKMTLPEIGFGITSYNNPLNFELLKSLNYTSVISNEGRGWGFWSSSPFNDDLGYSSWAISVNSRTSDFLNYIDLSVRCVGH